MVPQADVNRCKLPSLGALLTKVHEETNAKQCLHVVAHPVVVRNFVSQATGPYLQQGIFIGGVAGVLRVQRDRRVGIPDGLGWTADALGDGTEAAELLNEGTFVSLAYADGTQDLLVNGSDLQLVVEGAPPLGRHRGGEVALGSGDEGGWDRGQQAITAAGCIIGAKGVVELLGSHIGNGKGTTNISRRHWSGGGGGKLDLWGKGGRRIGRHISRRRCGEGTGDIIRRHCGGIIG